MKIQSYKDLVVWQKGFQLVLAIYHLTSSFPKNEQFSLTSQMRRAAISIASNIAEGYQRKSSRELHRFLLITLGSASELETQLLAAKELRLAIANQFSKSENLLTKVLKLTNCFLNKLNNLNT
jgi:four helix bundle protein